jgi:ABC-type transport system substrate-binding protein
VLGAALLAAVLTGCASGAATTTGTAPSSTSGASTTAASAPASPTTAPGTASSGGTLAAWYSTIGKGVVADLGEQTTELGDSKTSAELSLHCGEIQRIEQAAENRSAPPVPALATAWKSALQQIHQGWSDL